MKRMAILILAMTLAFGLGLVQAQDDPFAGLGGGEDDSGLAVPDGSSSIRAKKKASATTFEGRVEAVTKDDKNWPAIAKIKLKITKAATAKKGIAAQLKKGEFYEFELTYKRDKDGKFDFSDENNKLNIGAFYMERGDKVEAELKTAKDGKLILDFVQRKSKK